MAVSRAALRLRVQAFLRDRPWALAVGSGLFVALLVLAGASVDWDPWAPVGRGLRHLPLWLLLVLGVPLFGAGVVVGVVRQVSLLRRRSSAVPEPGPSPDVVRLRRDGPGWLSRREDEAGTGDDLRPGPGT